MNICTTLAIALLTAFPASAWEFTDHRGVRVSTTGRDTLIVFGQDHCVPLQRMVPDLAGLARDYPVQVIVLLPCLVPMPAVVDSWVATVPGASNVCVCEVWLGDLACEMWAATGYQQPAAFLLDGAGQCATNWVHYQTRAALEPAIGRHTVALRATRPGLTWPFTPLRPRLESSLDLRAWRTVDAQEIELRVVGSGWFSYHPPPASNCFYRLAW